MLYMANSCKLVGNYVFVIIFCLIQDGIMNNEYSLIYTYAGGLFVYLQRLCVLDFAKRETSTVHSFKLSPSWLKKKATEDCIAV